MCVCVREREREGLCDIEKEPMRILVRERVLVPVIRMCKIKR